MARLICRYVAGIRKQVVAQASRLPAQPRRLHYKGPHHGVVCAAVVLGGILAGGLFPATARAQMGVGVTPSLAYRAAFGPFYDGEYKDALTTFSDEARNGIRNVQSRWIDSICYETMVGECYYEMGRLDKALEHYTYAVKLYVSFYDWMIRVQFPPSIRPATTPRAVPWGSSSRQSRPGVYPASMLIGQGQMVTSETIQQGGVIQQPILFSLDVQEVVRCTTLAIRRRAKLLGPVSQHDPVTNELLSVLSRRPGPPNHWSESWVNLELGLALLAAGKELQAVDTLKSSLVAAGEFDHPLTSVGLLELGRIALSHGEWAAAAKDFEEATYAAAYYPDYGILEEAFRFGAITHLAAHRPGVYPPLAAAIQWAKLNHLRQLQASLLMLAAENYAVLGQAREAGTLLDEARATIGRRTMGAGRIGARLNYLSALLSFSRERISDGDGSLAAAMNFMRQGSFWLFQISLVDQMFAQGGLTPRVAGDLYQYVLRDPQAADWTIDPMESLSVLVTPHPLPYEHWFEVALSRKEHETALEIADRARRHRFFSSLPKGGRVLSLRWLLEGPTELLDQQSQLQRQDIFARYPAYAHLSQQARKLRATLQEMPLVPADAEAQRRQTQAFSQLAATTTQQEAILREVALRREPAALVFPPVRSVQEVQKSLPPGHAVLAFFTTSRQTYGFLLNKDKYNYWPMGSFTQLNRSLVALLRELGQYSQNHEVSVKDLADSKWKQASAQVLELLLKGSRADFSQKFDELVIVPDGVFWYLPFELLQVNADGQQQPLISRVRIRYVPTVSLATSPGYKRSPAGNTAVVVGRLHPRDDAAAAQSALERIAAVLPGTVALKAPLPASSALYASLLNRLVVLDDINIAGQGPYDWSPLPMGNKSGGTLSDWLGLPWGRPDEVILPGFHTAAEDSLKQSSRSAPGNEIFLSVCGLMASGARTVLLSRWRTGGQTSYDLISEFVQELPHTVPDDAWQRAVFLTMASEVNPEAEPRIKRTAADEPLKASHPFFWAGYLLVDTGSAAPQPDVPQIVPDAKKPIAPQAPAKDADQPAVKPQKLEKPKKGEPKKPQPARSKKVDGTAL